MSYALTKICTKCGNEKPATNDYFSKKKGGKYGLHAWCKKCCSDYKKKYSEENRDKIAALGKRYYKENEEAIKQKTKVYVKKNTEKISERRKQYRLKNAERIKRAQKDFYAQNKEKYIKYREDNKEMISMRKAVYRRNNPEKHRKWNKERDARKRNLPVGYSNRQWEETKQFFDNKCAYCGKEHVLQQDHFVPLSKNGEYTINNIVPACQRCNDSKYNTDFFEWYPTFKHYCKKREQKILKYLNYHNGVQQLMIDFADSLAISAARGGSKQ